MNRRATPGRYLLASAVVLVVGLVAVFELPSLSATATTVVWLLTLIAVATLLVLSVRARTPPQRR